MLKKVNSEYELSVDFAHHDKQLSYFICSGLGFEPQTSEVNGKCVYH